MGSKYPRMLYYSIMQKGEEASEEPLRYTKQRKWGNGTLKNIEFSHGSISFDVSA